MGKGLEGVVAASTGISYIDGLNGRLFYRGIDIDELAERSTFEETTALLWYGKLPTKQQMESFNRKFCENRQIPNELLALLMPNPTASGRSVKRRTRSRKSGRPSHSSRRAPVTPVSETQ